jgi:hypothetical protein
MQCTSFSLLSSQISSHVQKNIAYYQQARNVNQQAQMSENGETMEIEMDKLRDGDDQHLRATRLFEHRDEEVDVVLLREDLVMGNSFDVVCASLKEGH